MPLAARHSSRLADPLVPPSRRARSAQEYLKAPSSVPPPPRRRRQRIVYPLPAAFGTLALPVTKRSALFFSLCAVLIRRTSLARLTWGRARLASRAQGRELSARGSRTTSKRLSSLSLAHSRTARSRSRRRLSHARHDTMHVAPLCIYELLSGVAPSSPMTSARLVDPEPRLAGLGCDGSGFQPICGWEKVRRGVSGCVRERGTSRGGRRKETDHVHDLEGRWDRAVLEAVQLCGQEVQLIRQRLDPKRARPRQKSERARTHPCRSRRPPRASRG